MGRSGKLYESFEDTLPFNKVVRHHNKRRLRALSSTSTSSGTGGLSRREKESEMIAARNAIELEVCTFQCILLYVKLLYHITINLLLILHL